MRQESLGLDVKKRNANIPLTFMQPFSATVLSPTITDVKYFFQLLANISKAVFSAKFVEVWDNNVYSDCIVLHSSSPLVAQSLHTLPLQSSLTGLAIQRCAPVFHHNLHAHPGGRRFINHPLINNLGLKKLISIPVYNPYCPKLITFVINLHLDSEKLPAPSQHAMFMEWLVRSVGISLDYLLYRVEESIDHSIETMSAAVSGISGLFDAIFPDLRRLTGCTDAALFEWDMAKKDLILERSSSTTAISAFLDRHEASVDPCFVLVDRCVEQKSALMLRESVSNAATNGVQENLHRWSSMATPILSSSGSVLGVLLCRETEGASMLRSFSSIDLYILEFFARAIGPSMERFLRLRERSTLISVVREVASVTVGTDQLKEVLQRTIDTLVKFLDAAAGSIYILEEPRTSKQPVLIMRACMGPASELLDKAEYHVGEGLTGIIAKEGVTLNFKNVEDRHKYSAMVKYSFEDRLPKTHKSNEAFLGIPIQMKGRVVGVLTIEYIRPSRQHPEPYFTDEDVQIVQVISSFLGYVIESDHYKRTILHEFELLAKGSIAIEEAKTEEDAILAAMTVLEQSQLGDAMLSLFDAGSNQLKGNFGSGIFSTAIVKAAVFQGDSDNAIMEVLRNNKAQFFSGDTAKASPNTSPPGFKSGHSQYVLPLRVNEELIGTLQVAMASKNALEADDELILQAFAGYLAFAISRIRNVDKSVELTNQILASSRFIVAETLAGWAVHSLGHKLDDIIIQLSEELKRKEIKERKELLNAFSTWHQKLTAGRDELRAALAVVRADQQAESSLLTNAHAVIQESINMWFSLLTHNKCIVQRRLEASKAECGIPHAAFREIISVLLVNAVQAHAKRVEITTANAENIHPSPGNFIGTALCLECSDDGIGLMTDKPEEIFNATYTTKHKSIGTGLGLFIARTLARQAGGDLLVVHPNPRSKGVTFRLVLPAV